MRLTNILQKLLQSLRLLGRPAHALFALGKSRPLSSEVPPPPVSARPTFLLSLSLSSLSTPFHRHPPIQAKSVGKERGGGSEKEKGEEGKKKKRKKKGFFLFSFLRLRLSVQNCKVSYVSNPRAEKEERGP